MTAVPRVNVTVDAADVQWSPGDGRPLLLLLRMASRGMGVWDPVWDGLAARFSVAQFDLGMPSSAALEDPHGAFRRLSAHCAVVASALGHERFHLLGWNGGTHVALRCAIDHPGRVTSCTLLGPFFDTPSRGAVDKGIEFLRVLLESGDRELYAYYWFMNGLSPRFVAERFDQVDAWVAARIAGDRFLALDEKRAMRWIRALRGRWTSDAELAACRTPTLIVAHSEDRWHAGPSVDMAHRLASMLPAAELVTLEGYGSLVLLEAPEVFLAAADAFYARQTERFAMTAPCGPGPREAGRHSISRRAIDETS